MKTRQGFVSNSSSSSFILSAKSNQKLGKIKIEADVSELVEEEIASVPALKEYYIDNYLFNDDTEITLDNCEKYIEEEDGYIWEQYNKCKKAIEAGNVVFMRECSNDGDNPLSNFIYNSSDEDFKVGEEVTIVESPSR